MSDEFTYDVFLSYSSKDKAVVGQVAERLRGDGLRVWFDAWVLKAGDHVQFKIEEGLEQSRVLVLCMSKSAYESDWARLEAGTFRFRDPLNKERRFVPLRLDDAEVKGSLGQFLCVDWRAGEYEKLLEACQGVKGKLTLLGAEAERTNQLDCEADINAFAFSADGKRVITGADDYAVRLWDTDTGRCLRLMQGHTASVRSVEWSADQRRALSGSTDIRLWDVETGSCVRVFEKPTQLVMSLAWSPDQRRCLSGSTDKVVRLWDVETGRCLRTLNGHTQQVVSVAWSADGRRALSGSGDGTVRLWDVESGRCLRILEGHTNWIWAVAWNSEGSRALSGSDDTTVRLWELETGRCLQVLQGHTGNVLRVAWSKDGRRVLSGGGVSDKTIRLWDLDSGRCLRVLEGHMRSIWSVVWSSDQSCAFSGDHGGGIRVWDLSEFVSKSSVAPVPKQVQYTNAKVLMVGESGAGKTGLTERIALNTFTPSYSTSGTWATQWAMKDLPVEAGWEREIWLWDFGGQADQRLIHQLYVDNAALIVLVFNADRDVVLPGLREWQQALSRCVPKSARTYLVAGRVDAGLRFDREKVRAFAEQNGYRYFETSAMDGRGCEELRAAIQGGMPWDQLEKRTSPTTWKLLNDEILKLRDEGQVLFTFKELRETLRGRLGAAGRFDDVDLETVVGLLDGPGVVKELRFGSYVLVRPEWINAYAQAVIRTLRSDERSIGCLPVQSIAEGKLLFQVRQASGEIVEAQRLGAREEPVVLQAMEQMLVERKLCLRQEGNLVFPSYCGLEKPVGPVPPNYFISYVFGGFLDDVYATLVVKLVYCGAFSLKELWRDAADFETLAERRGMGVKMVREEDGRGTLLVHYGKGVREQEQVIFANYIHEHLKEKGTEAQRLRFHVCPHCDTPVKDREEAMRRLAERGVEASIVCVRCEERVPLWDSLEKRFASEEVKRRVSELQKQERAELDSRQKAKLLALEVAARVASADQKCFEVPGEGDGVDVVVEFAPGKRVYLQLSVGKARKRKHGADWGCPVIAVVGTFAEDEMRGKGGIVDVRWGKAGERLDAMAVRGWREKALGID